MFLDHESLKLEPKERRHAGIVNEYDIDMQDHWKGHQLLHVSKKLIWDAMVLVQVHVHVQWVYLEEFCKAKVDFHPRCHHLKKKQEQEETMAQMLEMAHKEKDG